MDKKKLELVIICVLVAVFLITFGSALKTIFQRRQAVNAKPSAQVAAGNALLLKQESAISEPDTQLPMREQEVSGAPLRDPFGQKISSPAPSSFFGGISRPSGNVLLTGIVWDKEKKGESYCIINGETLKTGDSIAGFKISKIREDDVILINEKAGTSHRLGILVELEALL